MVLEHDIPTFFVWLFGERGQWGFLAAFLLLVAGLGLAAAFICFLIAAVRHGPSEGLNIVARAFFAAFQEDLPQFSLRRTLAIAGLAVRESIRRKVLIVFIVFVILLLFAGLFLDVKNDHPARLYLSFVLTASNFLVLVLALLLSTFSLPNDIKTRTIYTIVTKPVRAGEIVVGRVAGFALVGTAILALMALVSYFFVVRGLYHEHVVDVQELKTLSAKEGGPAAGKSGKTTYDAHHSHDITVTPDGIAVAENRMGHTHELRVQGEGADMKIQVGPPVGMLEARVPIFGDLRTTGRDGKPGPPVNVGEEWGYRGYIEGGTAAELIWTFSGVTKERFPNGLPLELNLRVFRTYKGNIEKGVYGDITIRNPNRKISSDPMLFESKEFVIDSKLIPLKLKALPSPGGGAREIDLFDDLVSDGKVEVVIRCVERAQYFGAAKADVYLRAADRPFFTNFIKGYLGIWFQMLIVTCFGVMFSTFLNGPVTFLATCAAIALGFFGEFVRKVLLGVRFGETAQEAIVGGGPIESFIRMATQQSLTVDIEISSWLMKAIRAVDQGILGILAGFTYLLPDFNKFSTTHFVAYGYDVNNDLLAEHAVLTLAFCLVTSVVGYFFLKTREIAA
jgi:hypothetical protein